MLKCLFFVFDWVSEEGLKVKKGKEKSVGNSPLTGKGGEGTWQGSWDG